MRCFIVTDRVRRERRRSFRVCSGLSAGRFGVADNWLDR